LHKENSPKQHPQDTTKNYSVYLFLKNLIFGVLVKTGLVQPFLCFPIIHQCYLKPKTLEERKNGSKAIKAPLPLVTNELKIIIV